MQPATIRAATPDAAAIPAPSNATARDQGTQEAVRALGKLPSEKLRQLEETEHLIVSIMISREIQRRAETLVGDHTNELGNLMKALAGFRYEVARETDRESVEVYPPAKATPSALDQAIAAFKAAKGQE